MDAFEAVIKKIDIFESAIREIEDSCKVRQDAVVLLYISYAVVGFMWGMVFMTPVLFIAVVFKIVKTGFVWMVGW
jgi:hypothetical protein